MKSSNSAFYQNMVKPTSSKSSAKQLLFEEEQKKRAAKRSAALGNLQRTGVSSSPKQTTVSSVTKPQSGGVGNNIIQTKQNAFSPTAAAERTGMGGSAAGSRSPKQSVQRSHMAAGGYNAGRRPQEQDGNITRLTRNEAWNMLGDEAKGKVNYRVPDSLSSEGRDVFFQLMELPDWGLDSEKKDEKVVELRRSVLNTSADAKKETPLRAPTAYGNLGSEGKRETASVQEQQAFDEERLNNEDRYLKGLTTLASEQLLTRKKLLFTAVNYWLNKQNDYSGALITNQEEFEGSDMRFGFGTMANVGCEVISVFNLLTNAGHDVTLSEVALRFELNGAQMLGGFLGSNPYYCGRVLDSYGIPYTEYYSAQQLEEAAEPGDAIIMSSCWKDENNLPHFHTYFVKRTGYKNTPFFAYNMDYEDFPTKHGSAAELVPENSMFLVAYLIKGE